MTTIVSIILAASVAYGAVFVDVVEPLPIVYEIETVCD